MDKLKVRRFKNSQNHLAKKIAKAHKTTNFSVDYEQRIPSASLDPTSQKILIGDSSQIVFPCMQVTNGRNRLIVVMRFNGKCNSKKVGQILKRQFFVRRVHGGFEVISSFNPCTIAKL